MEQFVSLVASMMMASVWFTEYKRNDMRKVLRKRCLGLIIGAAVGDAKGIPYENMTHAEIQSLLEQQQQEDKDNIPRSMEDSIKNSTIASVYERCGDQNPYIPAFYGPGKWTDDTQLTIAMTEAIASQKTSSRAIDMNSVVDEHVKQWRIGIIGWGGTRTAIERLANKTHTYLNSGNVGAIGNGVLMKLSPLAFYFSQLPAVPSSPSSMISLVRRDEIITLTRMTHNSNEAIVTSLVFCHLAERVYRYPDTLYSKQSRCSLLHDLIQLSRQYESEYPMQTTLSSRLAMYDEYLTSSETITDQELIRVSDGGTFHCVHSLSMVIGILLAEKPNVNMILRAAYIGGDCDSNASMIGALVGGILGIGIFPDPYIDQLYDSEMLLQVGEHFFHGLQIIINK